MKITEAAASEREAESCVKYSGSRDTFPGHPLSMPLSRGEINLISGEGRLSSLLTLATRPSAARMV